MCSAGRVMHQYQSNVNMESYCNKSYTIMQPPHTTTTTSGTWHWVQKHLNMFIAGLENFCFCSFTLKLTRMRIAIWYDTWNQPEIGYFVLNTSSILSPTNLFLRISGWGHQEGKTWHGDKIYVWLHSLNKLRPGGCCSDAAWTLPTTLACKVHTLQSCY